MAFFKTFLAWISFLLGLVSLTQIAWAQSTEPGFSAEFSPTSIVEGGISTVTFTIDNSGKPDVTGLGFTATLPTTPANMVVSGSGASHTCDTGTVTASDGSGVVTFANGSLTRDLSCTVSFAVTAPTAGSYALGGVDLANSAGADVTAAEVTLTVNPPSTAELTFVKALDNTDIEPGDVATATYTMTNTSATTRVGSLSFNETLPSGVSVATPSNTSTTCEPTTFGFPTVTATDGGQSVSFFLSGFTFNDAAAALLPGESCTVSVDVTGVADGVYQLTSDPLNPSVENVAGNTVALTVTSAPTDEPQISKSFSETGVGAGEMVDLEFTVTNGSTEDMTNISFTDDLDAMLTGAVATGLPISNVCGTGSTISGTSLLTLSGGSLVSRTDCTFTVTVQIPGSAATGDYDNVTSAVTASVGGGPVVGSDTATDRIRVTAASGLTFTKVFNPSSVAAGNQATIDYSITNTNGTAATDITFSEDLATDFMSSATGGTNASNVCGAGSSFSSVGGTMSLTGGTLGAGASCNFSALVNVPADQPAGQVTSTSSDLTATVAANTVTTPGVSANLTVNGGVSLQIMTDFQDTLDGTNDGVVVNGDQFVAEFTLTSGPESTTDATAIGFTFDAADLGTGSTAAVATNSCGGTAAVSGGGLLTVSGVTLSPSNSCSISLTITAAGGTNANASASTSPVTFQASGASGQIAGAQDTIFIGDLRPVGLSHSFSPSDILAGEALTVTYTFDNPNTGNSASIIGLTHSLTGILPGLTPNLPPVANTCGTTVSVTSTLNFSSGTVPAGGSCIISVDLTVPGSASSGTYSGPTSSLFADVGGVTLTSSPSSAALTINNEPLQFSKQFLTNPVAPGDTVDLQFTVTNPLATALTDIAFTDNLAAMLTGATTTGIASENTCGATLAGGSQLTVSDGTLGANASCTITVPVSIPAGSTPSSYVNTTSIVTAVAGGFAASSGQASDTLVVSSLVDTLFTAAFASPSVDAGGATSITYTIRNNNTSTLSGLAFSHDIAGSVAGTAATGLPVTDVCGSGSSASGTGTILVTGGNLAAGEQCSFTVNLAVPPSASSGSFTTTTSALTANGLQVGDAASDGIDIIGIVDLAVSVTDGVSQINAGETTIYSIVVNNLGPSDEPAAAFGTTVPTNATCTYTSAAAGGATGNTAAGAGAVADTLSLPTGASITYTASCAVPSSATGSLTYSAVVTKSAGVNETVTVNNTASDSTTIAQSADLSIALIDSADPIFAGGSVTYTATVNNAGPSDASNVVATFTLPAGLTLVSTTGCAEDPNGVPTCSLGSVSAGGFTNFSVTATADNDTSGTVTALASVASAASDAAPGNNATSEGTQVLPQADIVVTKTDGVTSVVAGQTVTYAIRVSNAGPSTDPAVGVSDVFPAGLTCDYTSTGAGGATGNSSATGASSISDALSMPAGSTVDYTAVCLVPPTATGTLSNTVTATASVDDPNAGNNSATDADTTVTPLVFDFTKAFSPSTVSIGETATLTFTVDNSANTLASTGMAFTDPLPGGLVVAAAPNTFNSCGGTLSASSGASSVSLSGGTLAGGATCTISVDVVASVASTLNNVTTALSSNFPDTSPATASLAVNPAGAPLFTKSFAPASVAQGDISTLTLTIDNSANFVPITGGALTDNFPAGMVVAPTPNLTHDCGGSPTAAAGSGTLQYTGASIAASASCTISVDVRATGSGSLVNTSGDFTSNLPTASGPSATLSSTPAVMTFTKSFAPDNIAQTQSTTLTYAISNAGNLIEATSLAFTETLTGGLVVSASPAVTNTCGGTVSAAAGGNAIALSGGTLAAGATCEINIPLDAPDPGTISGSTSTLTSSLADVPAASATLTVDALVAPGFSGAFSPSAIAQGDTSVLTFDIANTNAVPTTGLAFSSRLPSTVEVAASPAATNTCGGSFAPNPGDTGVIFSGGTLAAGASCSVSVTVQAIAAGSDDLTSGVLTSDNLPDAPAATASLSVANAPLTVSMTFSPATTEEMENSTLIYSLSNSAGIAASAVTLNDTLPTNLVIAATPAASTTCTGALTATPSGTSVSLTGGTLAAGGSCTVSVPVTSNVVGDYTNALETASSSLGTSTVSDATLQVVPTTRGTITIRQIAEVDGAFVFSSAEPSLNFTINTVGGTGQQGPIRLVQGTYTVQQSAPAGVGNTSIQCNDADSSGDAASGTLTLTLSPSEALVCTISAVSSQQKTVDTINQFLTKRADLILSSSPDVSRRIDRLKRGFGNASSVQFANGDLKSLLPFSAQVTGSSNFTFSTSLLQMRQAGASLALAHGSPKNTMFVSNYRWDAWVELEYQNFDQGANGEGHFAIAHIGADYLLTPDILVGAMLQFDSMKDSSAANNSTVSGSGWMVGPYMTARLSDRLYFDGRIMGGRSTNDISPFNTYTDQFKTSRWLVQASLTGDFVRGNWTISPNASLSYYEENQDSYIDSLNVFIPGQTVSLGQIKIGPTFTGNFENADGSRVTPFFGFDAILNFGDTNGVTLSNANTSASVDGWRGRARAGIKFSDKHGTKFGISGSYDGIGQSDYENWGIKLDLTIPFN